MLPRENRFAKPIDIKKVLRFGKQCKDQNFFIRYLRSSKNHSRFAFIVSNKISKRATKRNRIRRRLRSLFFLFQKEFQENYDMIVIARPRCITLKYQEMKNEIAILLRNRRII